MEVHVLNGDALANSFPFRGTIICRECLIEGPVRAESFESFWKARAEFVSSKSGETSGMYILKVQNEFEQLCKLKPAVINLWFEHDLFCQANMWFVLHFIRENEIAAQVNRVMPPIPDERWLGFGRMQADDLERCYQTRIEFSPKDLELGNELWKAYQQNDFAKLKSLSKVQSSCFVYLNEVCEAHMQRFIPNELGRPQKTLKTILQSGITNFEDLFTEFFKREGIYGFGDTQVKGMLDDLSFHKAINR